MSSSSSFTSDFASYEATTGKLYRKSKGFPLSASGHSTTAEIRAQSLKGLRARVPVSVFRSRFAKMVQFDLTARVEGERCVQDYVRSFNKAVDILSWPDLRLTVLDFLEDVSLELDYASLGSQDIHDWVSYDLMLSRLEDSTSTRADNPKPGDQPRSREDLITALRSVPVPDLSGDPVGKCKPYLRKCFPILRELANIGEFPLLNEETLKTILPKASKQNRAVVFTFVAKHVEVMFSKSEAMRVLSDGIDHAELERRRAEKYEQRPYLLKVREIYGNAGSNRKTKPPTELETEIRHFKEALKTKKQLGIVHKVVPSKKSIQQHEQWVKNHRAEGILTVDTPDGIWVFETKYLRVLNLIDEMVRSLRQIYPTTAGQINFFPGSAIVEECVLALKNGEPCPHPAVLLFRPDLVAKKLLKSHDVRTPKTWTPEQIAIWVHWRAAKIAHPKDYPSIDLRLSPDNYIEYLISELGADHFELKALAHSRVALNQSPVRRLDEAIKLYARIPCFETRPEMFAKIFEVGFQGPKIACSLYKSHNHRFVSITQIDWFAAAAEDQRKAMRRWKMDANLSMWDRLQIFAHPNCMLRMVQPVHEVDKVNRNLLHKRAFVKDAAIVRQTGFSSDSVKVLARADKTLTMKQDDEVVLVDKRCETYATFLSLFDMGTPTFLGNPCSTRDIKLHARIGSCYMPNSTNDYSERLPDHWLDSIQDYEGVYEKPMKSLIKDSLTFKAITIIDSCLDADETRVLPYNWALNFLYHTRFKVVVSANNVVTLLPSGMGGMPGPNKEKHKRKQTHQQQTVVS